MKKFGQLAGKCRTDIWTSKMFIINNKTQISIKLVVSGVFFTPFLKNCSLGAPGKSATQHEVCERLLSAHHQRLLYAVETLFSYAGVWGYFSPRYLISLLMADTLTPHNWVGTDPAMSSWRVSNLMNLQARCIYLVLWTTTIRLASGSATATKSVPILLLTTYRSWAVNHIKDNIFGCVYYNSLVNIL